MTSAFSSCPLGSVIVSIWTVKIRPSKTVLISRGTIAVVRDSLFTIHDPDSRFFWRPSRQVLEDVHQVLRQRRNELQAAVVPRVVKHETCRVQEGACQPLHRLDVWRDAAMNAAIQRITDDRMTNGAE